jgi:hypothetical protein
VSTLTKIRPLVPNWAMPGAKRIYWLLRGRYPYRLARTALLIQSRNPRTFSQKIVYKMAHDRNPSLALFADKVQVRDFVKQRVGPSVLTEVHGIFESARHMAEVGMPRNFVMKPSHGSSAVVICWEGNDPGARITKEVRAITWETFLIHPQNLDLDVIEALADKWLNLDHSYLMGDLPEFAYKGIEPRIIVEEVLLDSLGHLPQDYKFFMFDGKCKLIQVDSLRFSRHTRDLFSPQWDSFQASYVYPRSEIPPPRPEGLDEMLEIAQVLSAGADFVRVDLYETRDGIRFGELTNYPTGGHATLHPESFDMWLGEDWHPDY